MAEFVYNPGRMSMLLRLAPWVDLEAAREEVLNRLKDAGFSQATLDRIESYEKGEVAVLPSSYSIQDEVVYAISDLYRRQMDHDRKFYDGVEVIKQYFMSASHWRQVTDDAS